MYSPRLCAHAPCLWECSFRWWELDGLDISTNKQLLQYEACERHQRTVTHQRAPGGWVEVLAGMGWAPRASQATQCQWGRGEVEPSGSLSRAPHPSSTICTHGQGCTRCGCPGAAENEGQLSELLSSLLARPCASCIVERGMEQSPSFGSVPTRSSPTLDALHLSSAASQHLGLGLSLPGGSHLCTSAQRL